MAALCSAHRSSRRGHQEHVAPGSKKDIQTDSTGQSGPFRPLGESRAICTNSLELYICTNIPYRYMYYTILPVPLRYPGRSIWIYSNYFDFLATDPPSSTPQGKALGPDRQGQSESSMAGARSPAFDSATAAGPNALVLSFAVSFLVLAAFNQTVLFLPPSTP